jgi:hypothetical protein
VAQSFYMRARFVVVALLLSVASCQNQQPAHLVLTLEGVRVPSSWQNGMKSGFGAILCLFPNDPALKSVDDEYCFTFNSAPVPTPASIRVVGTNSGPKFTFVPENGNAPEVQEAYMNHDQFGASWDSDQQQQQHVDGTVKIDYVGDHDCGGSLDIDVVGALPPKDLDVVIHAHLSGTFAVKDAGW